MRVFLDFEASSLADDSYPIEVGWVFEDGQGEAWLIRPAEDWLDWDPRAEAVHHLSREKLMSEGAPHDQVARRMVEVLTGHDLFASAPSWDGKWLSVLLRRSGLPRRTLTLRDTDEAHTEVVRDRLRGRLAEGTLDDRADELIRQVRAAHRDDTVRHRALEDAEAERRVWLEVGRLAEEDAWRGVP